jgi:S1-C subfamily serine protease/antitoxin component YwqK of YwqJK toxin-antitoxin module
MSISLQMNAQDIIYFDKKGKLSNQQEGYYFRKKETGNLYKSIYINGGLTYFEGTIITAHPTDDNLSKYSGNCKWYYKNGGIKTIKNFTDKGIEDGTSIYYYESGKVWKEIEYVKGEIKGNKFIEYTEDGRKSRIFEDNFTNNANDWDIYASDKSSSKISNGVFELTSNTKAGTSRFINATSTAEDITIEATFDLSKLEDGQKAGLIFGFKDWNNYNYYLVSNAGFYVGFVYEGISAEKVQGMFSAGLKKKQKNILKLLTADDKTIFSINGEVEYSCARFTMVGSNIGFSMSGKGTVLVDNLICKEINYSNSSVSVSKSDYDVKATGSGILISENGYIITNEHVIDNANKIQVELTNEGVSKTYSAILVQKDKDNDLAILKINDEAFKPLPKLKYSFKESGAVEVGSSAFTIGFPLALSGMGKEAKYTDGKVSSKTGYNGSLSTFQTSIPVQPGNSGGPVFNNNGELMGLINASVSQTDNVSYAVKLNYIKNLIEAVGETSALPNDKSIQNLLLEEKIKILSNYVTLIKIK